MKKIILAITMLLAISIPALSVSAQSLEDAEGLETAYGRNYSSGSSTASVSSASSSSTPTNMEAETTYSGLEVIGLTFDSDDNAENFLEEMQTGIQETIDAGDGPEDTELKDLDDLDIDKNGFVVIGTVENTGVNATAMFVDGNDFFLIDVVEADFDTATELVTEVTKFVVDAETDSDDILFSEDGTSTGGVFDRMPTADDDLIGDLTPTDYKMFPED